MKEVINALPCDNYPDDSIDQKQVEMVYHEVSTGKNSNGVASSISPNKFGAWSRLYFSNLSAGWQLSNPSENERVPLLEGNCFGIYIKYVEFELRLPFSNF